MTRSFQVSSLCFCEYRPENDDGPSFVRVSRDTQLVLPNDIQLRVGCTLYRHSVGTGTGTDNTAVGRQTRQTAQGQGQQKRDQCQGHKDRARVRARVTGTGMEQGQKGARAGAKKLLVHAWLLVCLWESNNEGDRPIPARVCLPPCHPVLRTSSMHSQSYSVTRYEYSYEYSRVTQTTAPQLTAHRQARLPQAPVAEQSVNARVVDLHLLVLKVQKAEALHDYGRCTLGSPPYTV